MWFEISWSFGTLGPLDLGTLRHRHSWTSSSCNTFTYFPLHLFTSSVLFHLLFSFSMVLIWGGGVVTLENEIRWTIDLYIDLKKLCSGYVESWDLLLLILPRYSTLLPNLLLTPLNSSYLLPKGLRWLISSYKMKFQCYSAQKSFMVVVGGIAIIATRSRSLRDLR